MVLNVYPDPSKNAIVIETGYSGISIFKLFNCMGKLVILSDISETDQLPTDNLDAGIYSYKLISESRLQVGRITITTKSPGSH
jgi:hypothetical protein